ncbi:MAG: MFS transporter [Terrimicrobiaceae bacterium]|nr:MFS transporter [Terrimicrobiaceae bacterium]
MSPASYRWVTRCCYTGMFVQAAVINLTPLLFIPLRNQFGLTFEEIGRLVLINFLTQMLVDLLCTGFAHRIPTKLLIVLANLLAASGLVLFAVLPFGLQEPYAGLLVGTVVFSIGCGLLEVLLSPIINAIPSERKAGDMAMLHAFYPVGKVAVIVLSGAALFAAGERFWPVVAIAWAIVPLINTLAFTLVRLPPMVPEKHHQSFGSILRGRTIFFLLAAMALAGATEVTIAQWTSAFVERGLGFSKVIADLVGFALFGVGMIIGRVWFGLHGEHGNLHRVLAISAALSFASCLTMALVPHPAIALAACAMSGLFVSMLWPGTLSVAAARFPGADTRMFALLAAAGDAGAGIMPWAAGLVADGVARSGWATDSPEALGLRMAVLVTAACPLLMLWVTRRLRN